MATTYAPIATTTLATNASSIVFSSIPATYTDLRIVLVCKTDSNQLIYMRFNSSSTGYSETEMGGYGSSTISYVETNMSMNMLHGVTSVTSSNPSFFTIDVMSYAGSTYKTSLVTASQDYNGTGSLEREVCLWRNTSAITSVTLAPTNNMFVAGTTATIFGIKAA